MDPALRTRPRCRCAGVTLTEAIVASTLLLLSIIPLLKALTVTHVMDRSLERKSWSLLLAQEELERIRARCICRYDESCRMDSKALGNGYLVTVLDDGDPLLKTVIVTAGFDRNTDAVLAADEIEVRLCTSIARR